MEQHLLGDYIGKMFRRHTRLEYETFNFLINIVAPSLQKQNTHVQDCILVDKCGELFHASLGSGNNLMSYRKQFGIPHSTASIIFSGFVVL
jgi:hypothetical protein